MGAGPGDTRDTLDRLLDRFGEADAAIIAELRAMSDRNASAVEGLRAELRQDVIATLAQVSTSMHAVQAELRAASWRLVAAVVLIYALTVSAAVALGGGALAVRGPGGVDLSAGPSAQR